jgi:membrane-associated phospholipid phosphatase
MPASFDGNDGNDGNTANAGSAGNATSISTGWFFADRVNLPLVTEFDTGPNAPVVPTPIGDLPIINAPHFRDRNWSADWYSWLALNDFAGTTWQAINPTNPPSPTNPTNPTGPPSPIISPWSWPVWVPFPPPADWSGLNAGANVLGEISGLVIAASNERADALAEILSQSNEFISYFLNMMTARPGAYPATTKVLSIASLVGTFVAMYFKERYSRPRPSQLCPALLPPIEIPGHASFPSGHSTQAHLMALCMNDVLNTLPPQNTMVEDLWTLADCIARNREIAGLHYPSDSAAGVAFAYWIHFLLQRVDQAHYQLAVTDAAREWQ